ADNTNTDREAVLSPIPYSLRVPHPLCVLCAKGGRPLTSIAAINTPAESALVEVGLVHLGKMSLIRRQFVQRKDRVLRAHRCAIAAIDALVGVDEHLGHCSGSRIGSHWRDRRGGTFLYTDKILRTSISNYVSH